MQRRFALALTAAMVSLFPAFITGARAQQNNLPCDSFQKNIDGSWTVLSTTFIEGPQVKVQEGAVVVPGRTILGYDIADIIAKACPNASVGAPTEMAPVAVAPGAPGASAATLQTQGPQGQPPQPPQRSLSRYADANGTIDVERLTCAQLDDTSNEEANVFLAWYSGWYSGLSKRHVTNTINIARLRYLMRNVVDYCRTNRDRRLAQVLELMLK